MTSLFITLRGVDERKFDDTPTTRRGASDGTDHAGAAADGRAPSPSSTGDRRDRARRSRLDREILALAVPALGALVAEPLFVLVDSAVVGHLGTAQLAGLSLASTLLVTLVGLCVFLAYATTAAVARRVGAGQEREALQSGIDGLWLALDAWLRELDDEVFRATLPLLRRAFSGFSAPERRAMGEKARDIGSPSRSSSGGEDEERLDVERANLVLPVLSHILGVEIEADNGA